MTIFVVWPDGAKAMLAISSVALIGFNTYAFVRYDLRHLAPAIRLFYMGNGLTIGMSITSGTLLWLQGTKEREQNACRESGVPEYPARTDEPRLSSGATRPDAVTPKFIVNSLPVSASKHE
ncbi:MAG TPA: hypothetical protein VK466_14155, partial [Terriglobales bacterium]|nr:hypothetical protein [Terriglobales bacterium]